MPKMGVFWNSPGKGLGVDNIVSPDSSVPGISRSEHMDGAEDRPNTRGPNCASGTSTGRSISGAAAGERWAAGVNSCAYTADLGKADILRGGGGGGGGTKAVLQAGFGRFSRATWIHRGWASEMQGWLKLSNQMS